MTDAGIGNAVDPPSTAGALLRQARQAQGLHIAALSASIKVAQKKLELLEADRFDELPDATFTRALAQTVCRSLKIDSAPVLALLPRASGYRLEHLGEGINMPFRERPGRTSSEDWGSLSSPAVWGAMLLVLGALLVYLLPVDLLSRFQIGGAAAVAVPVAASAVQKAVPASPTTAATTPAVAVEPPAAPASSVVETVFSAPPLATPAASGALASQAAAPLQLRASGESWIEVQDGKSQLLLSRMVQSGESVMLDGVMPLRVKIGNAAATDVVFRGEPVNLAPFTRDNVARLELK
jgi:cytoskeleton protein RodZ